MSFVSSPPTSSSEQFNNGIEVIDLLGMSIARCSESQLLEMLFVSLRQKQGGWLVTANLDFLRRFDKEEKMRALYSQADVRVADGMPLVWAAALQGTPLPERIAGSSLLLPLATRASAEGRSLYLLGGNDGVAKTTAEILTADLPDLRITGYSSPWLPTEPDEEAIKPSLLELQKCSPDIVLVALGSPKQEWLIEKLRVSFPATWFVGVGISFSFTTGEMARAPAWMQSTGLEWVHRLWMEPKRLGRRYLIDGIPFGIELLARSLGRRLL